MTAKQKFGVSRRLRVFSASKFESQSKRRRERVLSGSVKWGRWTFDPSDNTIEIRPRGYWFELSRLDSSTAVLDFIAQVSGKAWATNADVGALVRCLDELLRLQKTMCGGGMNGAPGKRLSEADIHRELRAHY